jgi:urease accessory protein
MTRDDAAPTRATGALRAEICAENGRAYLAQLYETGGLRLKCPRAAGLFQGVSINTAGGVVGGDVADYSFRLGAGARALLTSQSAEKIYRSDGATACVNVRLEIDQAGELIWAPQPAILFDGARFKRRIDAHLHAQARATLVESVVFGRLGMGEICTSGSFRDHWRIWRAGRLVFADSALLEGDIASALDQKAAGGGARAFATLIHICQAREQAQEQSLEHLREICADAPFPAGASLVRDVIIARFCAPRPQDIEAIVARALQSLCPFDRPRVWQ